jgi:hypothetical protein
VNTFSNIYVKQSISAQSLTSLICCKIFNINLYGLMGKPCFFVSLAEKCEPDLTLPFRLLEKIRNLSKPIIIFNHSNTIYAASVAFIAGYIVKKLNCNTPFLVSGPSWRVLGEEALRRFGKGSIPMQHGGENTGFIQ